MSIYIRDARQIEISKNSVNIAYNYIRAFFVKILSVRDLVKLSISHSLNLVYVN